MSRFFRPNIARMAGYLPGEQPRDGGFTKLNTNENPYPPSPQVKAAIAEAVTDRLRLYPDPMCTELCRAAAQLHGVEPEMILAGNGSDDILTVVTRLFHRAGRPGGLRVAELSALRDAHPAPGRSRRDGALFPGLEARPRRAGRTRPQAGLPGQSGQPLRHRDPARRSPSWRARSTVRSWSTKPMPISPIRNTTASPCWRNTPT